MQTVTKEQVIATLHRLGIQLGDSLLVHSAVQFLGRPEGGVAMYFKALAEACGLPAQGTLAVPAFNFGFARGDAFDPAVTPAENMGVLSEWVRQQPNVLRTPHPMQSLAVTGRWAQDLAGRDTPSAFDPGSAFERMIALDFKLLLLGADMQAVSMLHYSEQQARVPYRYWKEFTGPVRTASGWEERTYRMFVRDLELDPHIHLGPIQKRMEDKGLWRSEALHYGQVASCRLVDFVNAVDEFLSEDPWSLVTNRPAQGH